MARKEIVYLSLLADGRAIRHAKADAAKMMEMTERAAEKVGGQVLTNQIKFGNAMQVEMIATLVRGVTHRKVELKFKPTTPEAEKLKAAWDAMTDEERAKAPATARPPAPEIDMQKTLVDLPEEAWQPLGYLDLTKDDDENRLYMFELFSDPAVFKSVASRLGHGAGFVADPFAGKSMRISGG